MMTVRNLSWALMALTSLLTAPIRAQNWTPAASAPSNSWYCIASSSDGSKLSAGFASGGVYTSTNGGTTWALTGSPTENWLSLASSANGDNLIAGAYVSLYISTNAGASWTNRTPSIPPTSASAMWVAVASS